MKERFSKIRFVAYLLGVYILLQLLVFYFYDFLQAITLLLQEVVFISAILISLIKIIREEIGSVKKMTTLISVLFFISNLILFVFWISTVYLDPEINWHLQGNKYEVDPWYYILYLPVLNFLVSFLVVLIFFLYRIIGYKNGKLSK